MNPAASPAGRMAAGNDIAIRQSPDCRLGRNIAACANKEGSRAICRALVAPMLVLMLASRSRHRQRVVPHEVGGRVRPRLDHLRGDRDVAIHLVNDGIREAAATVHVPDSVRSLSASHGGIR